MVFTSISLDLISLIRLSIMYIVFSAAIYIAIGVVIAFLIGCIAILVLIYISKSSHVEWKDVMPFLYRCHRSFVVSKVLGNNFWKYLEIIKLIQIC